MLVLITGSWLPGTLEAHVRYCGLAFELIGILTVAIGLDDKRRLFNHPSLLHPLLGWWERRPRWGGKTQILTATGALSCSSTASGKCSVWRGVPPNASIDDRLAALEENLTTLRAEHASTAKRVEEEVQKQATAMASERRARELNTDEIKKQIETLGAGGLHLEAVGLILLSFGATLATLSTEIARWLIAAPDLLLDVSKWRAENMPHWIIGLFISLVVGQLVTWMFLKLLRSWLAIDKTLISSDGRHVPAWLTGTVERLFFTVLVCFDVGVISPAIMGWLALKLATNFNHPVWNKEPRMRTLALSALLAGLVSMLFAFLGGLVWAGKISLGN